MKTLPEKVTKEGNELYEFSVALIANGRFSGSVAAGRV